MTYKLIHIVSFDQPKEDWENYDISPHIVIERIPFLANLLFRLKIIDERRYLQHRNKIFNKVKYLNMSKRLKFNDNSIDAYFSSHVFEHLYLVDLRKLLNEIYITLKPGAVIRTVLPDLNKIMPMYSENDPNKFVNAVFENNGSRNYKNYHK